MTATTTERALLRKARTALKMWADDAYIFELIRQIDTVLQKGGGHLAQIGAKGGSVTGESKRRDQADPGYYKRISAKAVAARKAKSKRAK